MSKKSRITYARLESKLRTTEQQLAHALQRIKQLEGQITGLDIRTRALRLSIDHNGMGASYDEVKNAAIVFEQMLVSGFDFESNLPDTNTEEE